MPTTEHPLNSSAGAKPLRILLVEDSEDDAVLIGRHFQRAGYSPSIRRVETAEAMREAMRTADQSFPGGNGWDVILADYNLPRFSAPAALQLLKREGGDLPFIMMSGAVSEETAVAAMRAGAHDYISKQNLARLVPAVEREIGEANARRERREAEQALRSSEERFHRLVQAIPIGLLLSDDAGNIFYANDAFERLLGYTQRDIRDGLFSFRRILSEPDESTLRQQRDLLVTGRGSAPFEALCFNRAGERVPMLIGLTLLSPESDGTRQIAAFFVDLTEQKRGEETMRRTEKLAAAGRLAASIAHEINNPLEAITNCLYLMGTFEMEPQARSYLDTAQSELNRVAHIATQTLRFYRQSTRPVKTRVHDILDSVAALYEARARGIGITVERRYAEVPTLTAFEGELRQVMANLVGNALDAMHAGGRLILKIASSRRWSGEGEPGIAITVADTGCGMDAATLARAFEPFFSTKGLTGTGLGLWVSQNILEKHRGSVRVRSRKDRGTVFRIFLPLAGISASATSSPQP
jgi:PAS domain S-box-containing protein